MKVQPFYIIGPAVLGLLFAGSLTMAVASPQPITPENRAADMGVKILFTADPCGLPENGYGCYEPRHSKVIQIKTGLTAEMEDFVILHELAHVAADRAGEPQDECTMDRQAVAWGALESQMRPDCRQ